MKVIKCWFKGHQYNKPRIRILDYPPYIRIIKYVACKNCGKMRYLAPDEQFRLYFYGAQMFNNREDLK